MNLAKTNLDNIKWTERASKNVLSDVTVSIGSTGNTNIIIRGETAQTMTSTGYVQIGVLGAALIFKESDKFHGRKLAKKTKSENYGISFAPSFKAIHDWAEKYSGNFTARLFKDWVYIDGECPFNE